MIKKHRKCGKARQYDFYIIIRGPNSPITKAKYIKIAEMQRIQNSNFFGSTGNSTQGLTLGKLSMTLAIYSVLYVIVIFHIGSWDFCPGWCQMMFLLAMLSTELKLYVFTNRNDMFFE
jgi:hypothetical protein